MPRMQIVAGSNGAGKTSGTREFMSRVPFAGRFTWINPDDTTNELEAKYPEFGAERRHPNVAAASLSEARVDALIAGGKRDFVVETVLASAKYLERVREAKKNGFTVCMTYVSVVHPELAVARVMARVRTGGHDVDHDTVRRRWATSQQNLVSFIPLLDELNIYDNTAPPGMPMRLFADLQGGTLVGHAVECLPYLRRVIQNAMMTGVAGFQAVGF